MIPIQPFPAGPSQRSFVSGEAAARDRTRVEYFRSPDDNHLHATVWFGPLTEGPPDAVHGGAIAAVLDEAMGAASWMNNHPAVAARITIDYREMTPLGLHGRVESWIERIEGRKIYLRSRLQAADGTVHAEGQALFVELDAETRARMDKTRSMRSA